MHWNHDTQNRLSDTLRADQRGFYSKGGVNIRNLRGLNIWTGQPHSNAEFPPFLLTNIQKICPKKYLTNMEYIVPNNIQECWPARLQLNLPLHKCCFCWWFIQTSASFCFCLQNCSYQNKDHFFDETEDMVMNNEPCILTSNVVVLKMRGGSEGNKNN